MNEPLIIEERGQNIRHEELSKELAVPPFFARVLGARGVTSKKELDLSLNFLAGPNGLPGVDQAASRLVQAINRGERILVVGDFDADGATASALVVSLLREMGVADVDYLVPNRFEFGYGLTPEIVRVAAKREPALIITVDNGVSSVDGVQLANELGIDVVITDHHLPPKDLPKATAIVNPNLQETTFESPFLAGVGVAYYLMAVVRAKLRAEKYFESHDVSEPILADWLDLVALGTVADVVPLDRNNRILVYQGLRRMRLGHLRPGMRALIEISDRRLETLSAQDLGFAVGPRLNAAGRLDDIGLGIQCLLAQDLDSARSMAVALDELNKARRAIEDEMNVDAKVLISESTDVEAPALCVYDASWHQGVVGIVAGRMRERFHRPVIAFADSGDISPGEIKGSARSVPGLHIRDALDDVASRFPGLVDKFGGHAMAAGLTIKRIHLDRFRRAFADAVANRIEPRDLAGVIASDGVLAVEDLNVDNARLIEAYGPWGQGFDAPVFHGEFELISQRLVGRGKHLKLIVKQEEKVVDAIAFNQETIKSDRVTMAYKLEVNRYLDKETLQLLVEHVSPS
ncbi:MAG TPA: single-stranded-DNA-specific exonuclease RecJ [Gammaproteobacteria bacterium]|nr:single-stranded-DNA-specific exonuclease RecJ [Gammaproteobacteria bacterium]|tara:strand:- start:436 stop:2160 length:1725 start_codon:yes stop_codon:yes gene_type:complete